MTIENLIKAVPPPHKAFDAYDGPWEPIEAQIGVPLPPDYKDFVRLYGLGIFMDFVRLFVPRTAERYARLE